MPKPAPRFPDVLEYAMGIFDYLLGPSDKDPNVQPPPSKDGAGPTLTSAAAKRRLRRTCGRSSLNTIRITTASSPRNDSLAGQASASRAAGVLDRGS